MFRTKVFQSASPRKDSKVYEHVRALTGECGDCFNSTLSPPNKYLNTPLNASYKIVMVK